MLLLSSGGWIGPESVQRTPRPYPDSSKLPTYHYLSPNSTPRHNDDGSQRASDDFQPRSQLRKLHVEGKIGLDDTNKIEEFSNKYITSTECVKEYLEHLKNIEIRKATRIQEKHDTNLKEKTKSYDDYDWKGIYEVGELKKLKVCELDKYLNYHHLPKAKMTKLQKLQVISAHISQQICQQILRNASQTDIAVHASRSQMSSSDSDSQSEDDTGSSEDEILFAFGNDSEDDSE